MKISIVAPITLSLIAITLAGCGEGEDGIFGSGSSSNEFTISSFDKDSNAIARIDTKYRRGERDIQPLSIIGNYDTQNIDNIERSVVLANGFEGTLEERYIEVNGNQVSRPIYKNNSNVVSKYVMDYIEYDLFGVQASSYNLDKDTGNRNGVLTDLYNYAKIPNTVSFRSGAKCYTPKTTSDREFVFFNEKNRTGYQQLEKWIEVTKKSVDSKYDTKVETTRLGNNNRYAFAELSVYTDNNQLVASYSGVEYDNRVYTVNHVASDITEANRDDIKDVVDCTVVNDVAADFLESEIKRYY